MESSDVSETEKQTSKKSQEDLVIENKELKKDIVQLKEMLKKQFEQELENNIKNNRFINNLREEYETKIENLEKELKELQEKLQAKTDDGNGSHVVIDEINTNEIEPMEVDDENITVEINPNDFLVENNAIIFEDKHVRKVAIIPKKEVKMKSSAGAKKSVKKVAKRSTEPENFDQNPRTSQKSANILEEDVRKEAIIPKKVKRKSVLFKEENHENFEQNPPRKSPKPPAKMRKMIPQARKTKSLPNSKVFTQNIKDEHENFDQNEIPRRKSLSSSTVS